MVRLLDRATVIPGTRIPIGLDALLGWIVPGAGDAATGLATLAIFFVAIRMRVPNAILLRMLLNVGIDAAVGAVPLFGDLFDVFYRAADRNLALLKKHRGDPRAALGATDTLVIAVSILVVLVLIALPVATGVLLIHFAVEWLS